MRFRMSSDRRRSAVDIVNLIPFATALSRRAGRNSDSNCKILFRRHRLASLAINESGAVMKARIKLGVTLTLVSLHDFNPLPPERLPTQTQHLR